MSDKYRKRSNQVSKAIGKIDSSDSQRIKMHQVSVAWDQLNTVYQSLFEHHADIKVCHEWKWTSVSENIAHLIEKLKEHKNTVILMDNADASCATINALNDLLEKVFLSDNPLVDKFKVIDDLHYHDLSIKKLRKVDDRAEDHISTTAFVDFCLTEEIKNTLIYARFHVLSRVLDKLNLNLEIKDFLKKMITRSEELCSQPKTESNLLCYSVATILDEVVYKGTQISCIDDLYKLRFQMPSGDEYTVDQVAHFHQNPIWDKVVSFFSGRKYTNTEKALGLDQPVSLTLSPQKG